MSANMIFALVLKLVHFLIYLILFLKQWTTQFATLGLSFQRRFNSSYQNTCNSKIPLHLGMLIFEDTISYDDISKLIVWCLALGISHISLYDINGSMKRNSIKLKTTVECYKEKYLFNGKISKEIFIYSDLMEKKECYKNGIVGRRRLHIELLSPEDGKGMMVDITKAVCQKIQSKSLELKDVNHSYVYEYVHDLHKFPDPELILKFGAVDSTLGYLPWQIRLTEIFSLPSHIDIQYESFASVMMKYSKTNQRFGK